MTEIRFDTLGPGDYDRAKTVLNKAKHPGFVGRELFFRCATTGTVCIAVLDDIDVGVALIAKEKLQALSVIVSAQGRGVGQALMTRLQPKWVQAIGEKVAWFAKIGYAPYGAAKVGQNGKHAVQLMERTATANDEQQSIEIKALPEVTGTPADEPEESISFRELLECPPEERAEAELDILDGLMQKAILAEKFDSCLKIMETANKLLHGLGARSARIVRMSR